MISATNPLFMLMVCAVLLSALCAWATYRTLKKKVPNEGADIGRFDSESFSIACVVFFVTLAITSCVKILLWLYVIARPYWYD